MKRLSLLFLFISVSFVSMAQTINETIDASITKIKADGNIKVALVESDSYGFEATISNTEPENFSWTITDGTLVLTLKTQLSFKSKNPKPEVIATFNYKKLENVIADGGATMYSEGKVKALQFFAEARGNSSIVLSLESEDINVLSSNSSVVLNGTTDFFTARAISNGRVNGIELSVAQVGIIRAESNGECYVKGSRKLDMKASSKGSISYGGSAYIITATESTFGEIVKSK